MPPLSPPPPADGPFKGIKIFLHVRTTNDMTDKTKHDAKKAIKKLGGSLTVNLDDASFVVFHNGSEALLLNATAKGKPVVHPSFLTDCRNANSLLTFRQHDFVVPCSAIQDAGVATAAGKKRQREELLRPYLLDEEGEDRSVAHDNVQEAAPVPTPVSSPPPSTQALSDALDSIVPCAVAGPKTLTRKQIPNARRLCETHGTKQVTGAQLSSNADVLKPIRFTPERITITGPEEEKGFLRDIIVGFGAEFELKVFGRVKKPSHYVVLSDAITPKILLARITGAPMLTKEWVTDSLQFGGFVEPLPRHYHPLYVQPGQENTEAAPTSQPKSRVARDLERHRLELSGVAGKRGSYYASLLASMTFYLLGNSENPTNEVYAELLRLMGASIAKSFVGTPLTAVIEVDGGLARNTQHSQVQRDQLRSSLLVSTAWIVETASTGVVAPFEAYAVPADAASTSLQALIGGLTPLAKTKQGPSSATKHHILT